MIMLGNSHLHVILPIIAGNRGSRSSRERLSLVKNGQHPGRARPMAQLSLFLAFLCSRGTVRVQGYLIPSHYTDCFWRRMPMSSTIFFRRHMNECRGEANLTWNLVDCSRCGRRRGPFQGVAQLSSMILENQNQTMHWQLRGHGRAVLLRNGEMIASSTGPCPRPGFRRNDSESPCSTCCTCQLWGAVCS